MKGKDDIGDSQGRPEDNQQCQDLTRTSAAKSGHLYDVARGNSFEILLFVEKNSFGES